MGRVGAFFFIGNHIISNDIDREQGDKYGDYINYSSHWDLWRAFVKLYPEYESLDYDYFPRGRVVYSMKEGIYILYVDSKLNGGKYIDKIKSQYQLEPGKYKQEFDEHYQSQQPIEDIDDEEITEDVIFTESLDKYVTRETY